MEFYTLIERCQTQCCKAGLLKDSTSLWEPANARIHCNKHVILRSFNHIWRKSCTVKLAVVGHLDLSSLWRSETMFVMMEKLSLLVDLAQQVITMWSKTQRILDAFWVQQRCLFLVSSTIDVCMFIQIVGHTHKYTALLAYEMCRELFTVLMPLENTGSTA